MNQREFTFWVTFSWPLPFSWFKLPILLQGDSNNPEQKGAITRHQTHLN